jgi:hypothetical protein
VYSPGTQFANSFILKHRYERQRIFRRQIDDRDIYSRIPNRAASGVAR